MPLPGPRSSCAGSHRLVAMVVACSSALAVVAAGRRGWPGVITGRSARPIRSSAAMPAFYVFSLPFLADRARHRPGAGRAGCAGRRRSVPRYRQLDLRLPVAAVGSPARAGGILPRWRRCSSCCWPPAPGCAVPSTCPAVGDVIFGATYADVAARMPAALLLVGVCSSGAALAVMHALTPRNWPIPVAAGSLRAGGRRRRDLQPACCSGSWSRPTSRRARAPFIQHNIDATRRAFALDAVEERELSRRCAADARRHRAQQRDARERPAVGSPAAARDVRPAPGDPHLLRLRLGGQRPLPHRRQRCGR